MVEAVDAVSDWFLSQPSIFRIWAEVDTENLPSARVLEKASFEREGTLRRGIMSPNMSGEPRDAFIYGRVE
jgi:RimJ/RimL family protein N-acetyltransferase